MNKRLAMGLLIGAALSLGGCAGVGGPGAPSIEGSTWAGTDSDGDAYVFTFMAGGKLKYRSPQGEYTDAVWKQDGTKVYMAMNNKYSEYNGVIEGGNTLAGSASNVRGKKWTFRVRKQ